MSTPKIFFKVVLEMDISWVPSPLCPKAIIESDQSFLVFLLINMESIWLGSCTREFSRKSLLMTIYQSINKETLFLPNQLPTGKSGSWFWRNVGPSCMGRMELSLEVCRVRFWGLFQLHPHNSMKFLDLRTNRMSCGSIWKELLKKEPFSVVGPRANKK